MPDVLAEPADDAILEHAQQLDLRRQGVSSISSRKTGAAGRRHQLTVVALDGAGERAARVAEQLAFHQLVGMAAQLIGTNRGCWRGDQRVKQPRGDLLAGAGLAGDQHRHRRRRDARDLREDPPRRRALGDEVRRRRRLRVDDEQLCRRAISVAIASGSVSDIVGAPQDRSPPPAVVDAAGRHPHPRRSIAPGGTRGSS